jgi:hypothetical protein
MNISEPDTFLGVVLNLALGFALWLLITWVLVQITKDVDPEQKQAAYDCYIEGSP